MDAIRAEAAAMEEMEREVRVSRMKEMEAAYRTAIISGVLSGLVGTVLAVAVALLVLPHDDHSPAAGLAPVGATLN